MSRSLCSKSMRLMNKKSISQENSLKFFGAFLMLYCQRGIKETILRLQYLQSLFGYMALFPGAMPDRKYRFELMKKIEKDLERWRDNLKKNRKILRIEDKKCSRGKDPMLCNIHGIDPDTLLRQFAQHQWEMHNTIKTLRQAHRFIDRRIDSLALIPLIPRRFARMSAIKNSALWREIVSALSWILVGPKGLSNLTVGITWEHLRTAQTFVVDSGSVRDDIEDHEQRTILNLTLPAWNLFWFSQSMSLYHELTEALLIALKENSIRSDSQFFKVMLNVGESIYYGLAPLLLSVGAPALNFRVSIANELTADWVGVTLGGPYYFLYTIYQIVSSPRMSSALCGVPFSHVGSRGNEEDRELLLKHDHLDLHRFKEILRIRFLMDLIEKMKDTTDDEEIKEDLEVYSYISKFLFEAIRRVFHVPNTVPLVFDALEATTRALVEKINYQTTFERKTLNEALQNTLNYISMEGITEGNDFCETWMFSGEDKENCEELTRTKFILSSYLLKEINQKVIENLEKHRRNKFRIKSPLRPLKSLIPVFSMGLVVERVAKLYLYKNFDKVKNCDVHTKISRKIHAFSAAVDFLDYVVLQKWRCRGYDESI